MWLLVTKDKYEFPIYIEDTAPALAKKCGVSVNRIYSAVSHAQKEGYKCRYIHIKEDKSEDLF